MSTWTDGYISEVGYTHGFYRELAPSWMRYALTLAGLDAPPLDDFRYCELGFGQGLSCNLLASANPGGEFWGTDFNPQQAAGAQRLAGRAELPNTHWLDDSFREFLDRDTPPFDFIALHGIYSWVNAENRQLLVEIMRHKLKVGGVVYISYNALPGWNKYVPLRYLLKSHAEAASAPGDGIVDKCRRAIGFAEELSELGAGYFGSAPSVPPWIKHIKNMDGNYIVHEYLNQHWTPTFFKEILDALEPAKLSFATSANMEDGLDILCLPDPVAQRLAKISDPILRETTRDFCLDRQFRRDLFVRGRRPLTATEQHQRLLEQRFVLSVPRQQAKDKINMPVGEMNLRAEVYPPILDILAHGPIAMGELLEQPSLAHLNFGKVAEALRILVAADYAAPCHDEAQQRAATAPALRFNRAVLDNTQAGRYDFRYLASPCMGSGIRLGNLQQLFLQRWLQGVRDQEAWVQHAWSTLQPQGRQVAKEGQVLETEAECLAELRTLADSFASEYLPVLQRLKMV